MTTPEPGHMTITSVATKSSGSIAVSAVTTAVPELMITPAIVESEAGAARIDGGELQLTHAHTGRSVIRGSYNELQDLAGKLADIPWTFTDPEHFKDPANSAALQQVQAIIREWMTVEDNGAPICLMGDDEADAAARGAEPSQTLLREQLDWWLKHAKSIHDRNLFEDNKALWYESISTEVQGFGVIYLIAVLRQIDPAVADIASRHLYASWDSGEVGEWVYDWSEQLAAGKPLSIYAIPKAGAMAEFIGAGDIVDRAESALEGTTEGPWATDGVLIGCELVKEGPGITSYRHAVAEMDEDAYDEDGGIGVYDGEVFRPFEQMQADAEFLAASRQLVPELVAEIKRLRGVTR